MKNTRAKLSALIFALAALSIFDASANVYFKGKVMSGGSTANCPVDITRIMWGSDGKNAGERIQAQIQLREHRFVSLVIIIQSIDNAGNVQGAYSLRADMVVSDSWFFFDFPQDKNIKSFQIVNVIINGQEVPYNLKIAGNRLIRSLTTLPKMKDGRQGEMSVTTKWIPETTTPNATELAEGPSSKTTKQGISSGDKTGIKSTTDEISGETTYTIQQNWNMATYGATFSITPSVISREEGSTTMEIVLSGKNDVNTGYGFGLRKILFYNPVSKKRATIDKDNFGDGATFFLGREQREIKIKLPEDCINIFKDATALKCRLTFGTSDNMDARNHDLTFSQAQARAFAILAQKYLEIK